MRLFILILSISYIFSNSFEELVDLSRQSYEKGNYEDAYNYSLKILEIDSTYAYAHFIIGDYYGLTSNLLVENVKKAYYHYDKAVEYKKDFILALYQRGSTKMHLELNLDFCDDINSVQKLIDGNEDFIYLLENNKQTFFICNKVEEHSSENELMAMGQELLPVNKKLALLFFNDVIQNNNQNSKAYYFLSFCMDDIDKKNKLLLQAIKLDDQLDDAYRILGENYFASANIDEAINNMKKCAELNNEQCVVWLKENGFND